MGIALRRRIHKFNPPLKGVSWVRVHSPHMPGVYREGNTGTEQNSREAPVQPRSADVRARSEGQSQSPKDKIATSPDPQSVRDGAFEPEET